MVPKAPASVVWLFALEDEPIARELMRLAAVLETQGLITNWSELDIPAGQDWAAKIVDRVSRADVVMILASPAMLDEGPEGSVGWKLAVDIAARNERTRLVPVLVSSTVLPAELSTLQVLPRDGDPLMARRNRDEVLLEVILGLQEIVAFRSTAEPAVIDRDRQDPLPRYFIER